MNVNNFIFSLFYSTSKDLIFAICKIFTAMKKQILTLLLNGLVLFLFSQTNEFRFNLVIHTDTVCPGDEVLVTANITSGIPPFQFKDESGDIISPPFKVFLDSTDIIIVSGKDAIGGTWDDNIKINIYKKPDITIKSDIVSGCQPLEVSFNEETSSTLKRNYYWKFGDGGISQDKNPNHIFEEYGNFTVDLEVRETHGDKVCRETETAPFTIDVFEKPESNFIVDEDVQNVITPTFYFENLSDIMANSYWDFGDTDSSIIYSPSHKYDSIGDYIVKLVTETSYGCRDTATKIVTVNTLMTFYQANAFTPDNDGINDVFVFKGFELDTDEFNFKVYDRWGHIIFETNDVNQGWDGHVYGNKLGKPGIYAYVVVIKDFKGVEFTESGIINLIR